MLVDAPLHDTQVRDWQLQAMTHKQYLETLMASVKQGQRRADDPVLLREVQQLTHQFATIHAAILRQQKERLSC